MKEIVETDAMKREKAFLETKKIQKGDRLLLKSKDNLPTPINKDGRDLEKGFEVVGTGIQHIEIEYKLDPEFIGEDGLGTKRILYNRYFIDEYFVLEKK